MLVLCRRVFSNLVEFKLADIGEGIKKVNILQWFVKEGDRIKEFDKVAEVQSDKATVEITSRYEGVVKKKLHAEGDEALVGETLLEIETNSQQDGKPEGQETKEVGTKCTADIVNPTKVAQSYTDGGNILAVPSVKKYAKEMGIEDLSLIKINGRITKEDIDKYLQSPTDHNKLIKLTPFQKSMSELMSKAALVPHLGLCDEYQVQDRQKLLAKFVYHLSRAIEGTNLNASYDGGEFLKRHSSVNVGIAIDTPHGLAVPNIPGAEKKSVEEVEAAIKLLASKAKENKLSKDELRGGTVTVSNVGAIGGGFARPVLVVPQVLIVALGQVRNHLLPVSWAADHRVIDGASIARLSQSLKWKFQNNIKNN